MSTNERRGDWVRFGLLGGVLGICVGIGGVAIALSDEDAPTEPPDPSMVRVEGEPMLTAPRVAARGDGLSADEAIDKVLASLDSKVIQAMNVVEAPASALDPAVPWVEIRAEGIESDIETSAPGSGSDLPIYWEASLAVGAVADYIRTDQAAANSIFGGSHLLQHLPSGEIVDLGGGVGYVAAGQIFQSQQSPESDEAVRTEMTRVLAEFELVPVEVRVLHPLGQAVAVVAALPPDAKVDWTIGELRQALAGDVGRYEGIYVEIQNARGSALIRSGIAHRTGDGGLWFAEGQAERFGAIVSGIRTDQRSRKHS
jgi:hypothetical protein